MKNIFTLILLFSGFTMFAQDFTISGTLTDSENGEDLIGARVLVKGRPGVGAVTNVYGFYSLTLPKGEYTLLYQSISFGTIEVPIILDQNIKKNLESKSKLGRRT